MNGDSPSAVDDASADDDDDASSSLLDRFTIRLLHLYLNRSLNCPGLSDRVVDYLQDDIARIRLNELQQTYTCHSQNTHNMMSHETAGPALQEIAAMMKGPFASSVSLLQDCFQVILRILQSVPDLMIGWYQPEYHWQRQDEDQTTNWRQIFRRYNLPVILRILDRHQQVLRSACCRLLYQSFMFVFRADARVWNLTYVEALLDDTVNLNILTGRNPQRSLSHWTDDALKDTSSLLVKMIQVLKENPTSCRGSKSVRLESANQRIVSELRERRDGFVEL